MMRQPDDGGRHPTRLTVDKFFVAAAVGGTLLLVGGLFLRWNVREWRAAKQDGGLGSRDRLHYYRRFRRRVQTSAVLILLGVLLPVTLLVLESNAGPAVKSAVFLAVILLTGWLFLLALVDMAATRAHSRSALTEIRARQQELERRLAKLKSRSSNGKGSTAHPD
jgi:hypothetical protein